MKVPIQGCAQDVMGVQFHTTLSLHRGHGVSSPCLASSMSACVMCRTQATVCCWGGRLWVRVSAQYYNELDDYRRLADAVAELRSCAPLATCAANGLANGTPPQPGQM